MLLLLLLINIIRSSPYYSDIIWKEYLLQPILYTQLIIWYWKFATKRTLVIHWWFIIGDLWLATEDNFTGNDDVMKTSRRWENFQYYWPLVRKQLIPSTMGQRCGSLMVAWLLTWLFKHMALTHGTSWRVCDVTAIWSRYHLLRCAVIVLIWKDSSIHGGQCVPYRSDQCHHLTSLTGQRKSSLLYGQPPLCNMNI